MAECNKFEQDPKKPTPENLTGMFIVDDKCKCFCCIHSTPDADIINGDVTVECKIGG